MHPGRQPNREGVRHALRKGRANGDKRAVLPQAGRYSGQIGYACLLGRLRDRRACVVSDQERLAGYVEVWWSAVGSFTALLEAITPAQWSLPTDLPGWDVQAIASHVAHLE